MKKQWIMYAVCLCAIAPLHAQSWIENMGNRVKDKAVEKVEERIENKAGEAVDKGLDEIENTVTGKSKSTDEEASDEETATPAQTKKTTPTAPANAPTLMSNTKYDFVPGDKILYFEDFAQDAVGDFPALWTTNGGGEVKTLNLASGNWFHMNKEDAVYCYTKSIAFPQNFIMEFDVIPDGNFSNGYTITFYEDPENVELTDDLYPGTKGLHISFDEGTWYTKGYHNEMDAGGWIEGQSTTKPVVYGQVNHVIIWVQNRRVRMYHQGAKVLDMPTNIHAGCKFNRFRFSGWSTYSTPYVSNLKITTATPDMRSKLLTEGKLVTYGIYFDVNKDVVKAESFGTISEIAQTLKENPTVRIKIIGHTDSDGDDAKNLDLSKRRALSVKNTLVNQFGIDASRIQTDGKGETEPLAPNTTSESKAKNRRVEFIKL
jgi:outer membrane protein OmpA-like peptidoglycan-associated protein